MKRSVYCDLCQCETETAAFEFVRHQGLLVLFYQKRYAGYFCADCAHRVLAKTTVPTLVCGWLGFLSAILAPVAVVTNLLQASRISALRPKPVGASPIALNGDSRALVEQSWAAFEHLLTTQEPDRHAAAAQVEREGGPRAALLLKYLDDLQDAQMAQSSSRGFDVNLGRPR